MRPILAKTGASAACALALAITCTGFTFAATRPSAAVGGDMVSASGAGTVSATQSPPPTRPLPSPGCTTATAPSADLKGVRTAKVSVSEAPFGVATTGRWAFVAVADGVEVLRADRSLAPSVVRTIRVAGGPAGLAITPDGRDLLAAVGSGAVVISVARAERGTAGAVLGTLSAPSRTPMANSAIEVAISPGGQFAFVTLEYADTAVVFNLGEALRNDFAPADYVGSVPLGEAAVGLAISPTGRWLYATSELGPRAGQQGTLTVIGLERAETHPASSVVARVDAGCQPVRVITAADGSEVWVTARASDDLLCFSAARLASDPAHALAAVVRVGEAPVGLAAVRDGSLIVVADSNRFSARGATADLDVVNVVAALSGRPAVVGHIPAGLFPREMALLNGSTLLVSDYRSNQVEAVDVASIPANH
jgi:DNA-binding beta-propeller fold protein YncE